jgi:hypothetical protein
MMMSGYPDTRAPLLEVRIYKDYRDRDPVSFDSVFLSKNRRRLSPSTDEPTGAGYFSGTVDRIAENTRYPFEKTRSQKKV